MSKVNAFTYVSVDGFFAGPRGEIDWFKVIGNDPEYEAFTHRQAKGGGALLMGDTTYEMMKSYWPTPEAAKIELEDVTLLRRERHRARAPRRQVLQERRRMAFVRFGVTPRP